MNFNILHIVLQTILLPYHTILIKELVLILPGKTVNVLPGNDIYITGLVMFIVDIELLNYLIQA